MFPKTAKGGTAKLRGISATTDTQNCSYTHDDLSRIASVNCLNGATKVWNQNFAYDAFGNITKTIPTGGTGTAFQPTYSSTTNWITALPGASPSTDSNGQMLNDGVHAYTWDSEGKMHSLDSTTLTHDALGRMVEKAVGSTYTQFVYGPLGKKFATMNGATLAKAFVPLPAGVAVYTASGLAYYRHHDHLGNSRLATTPSRTVFASGAYAPFGEMYAQTGGADSSFTGQDADTGPGMRDFMFRKYRPPMGRWLSPDPAGMGAVDPANPQSWNRYAYVMNNPMSLVDPLGLYCGWDDGSYDADPSDGGASESDCGALGGTWYPGSSPNTDPPAGFSNPNDPNRGTGPVCPPGECHTPDPPPISGTLQMPTIDIFVSFPGTGGSGGNGPVTCSTVLPDGSTVGSHVNTLSNQINNAANSAQPVSTPYGPAPSPNLPGPISVASQVYSGTNFRRMYGGPGANYQLLGDAGNFAYFAVSSNIGVPLWTAELVAGGYSITHHPPSDWVGPFGMDPSATRNVSGYGAKCN